MLGYLTVAVLSSCTIFMFYFFSYCSLKFYPKLFYGVLMSHLLFVLYCFHVVPFFVLHSFHVGLFSLFRVGLLFIRIASFFFCISSSVALFPCCNFSCYTFSSSDLHFWPASHLTHFMVPFFSLLFVTLCTFHIALFHIAFIWCCTFSL